MPVKRELSPGSSDGSSMPMPSPSPSPKKMKSSPKKESSPDKPKHTKNPWTADEDAIFIELMNKTLKTHLFQEVKVDGRLTRESSAVKAHLTAMMNKVKRGEKSQ